MVVYIIFFKIYPTLYLLTYLTFRVICRASLPPCCPSLILVVTLYHTTPDARPPTSLDPHTYRAIWVLAAEPTPTATPIIASIVASIPHLPRAARRALRAGTVSLRSAVGVISGVGGECRGYEEVANRSAGECRQGPRQI